MLAASRVRASRGVFPAAPDQFSDLQLWLKADAITGRADNDPVTVWLDASSAALTATQATGAAQPLYKTGIIGGLPVVRFDGTDDHLRCDGAIALFNGEDLPISIIAVVKIGTVTASATFIAGGSSTTAVPYAAFRAVNPNWQAFRRDDAAAQTGLSGGTVDTSPHVVSMVTSGFPFKIYADGPQVASGNIDRGPVTVNRVGIGAMVRTTVTDFLNGDIAELVIYNRALTTGERRAIELHLGAKYGIAVT